MNNNNSSQPTNNDEKKIMIDYLLGNLSEEEQTKVEEKCFTDDDFYEQVSIVEAELIDSYLQGGLVLNQKKQFEEKFLKSIDGKQKLNLAKTFLNSINKTSSKSTNVEGITEKKVSEKSNNIFSFFKKQPLFPMLLAASLVVSVGGTTWLAFETTKLKNQLKQLQQQQEISQNKEQVLEQKSSIAESRYQEVNKELIEEKQKSSTLELEISKLLEKTPQILSLVLTPDLQRDSSKTKILRLTNNAQLVQLKLILEEEQNYQNFQIVVKTVEGKTVLQQKVTSNKIPTKALSFSLKTEPLKNDDYIVTLSGVSKDNEILELADYYFRVLSK